MGKDGLVPITREFLRTYYAPYNVPATLPALLEDQQKTQAAIDTAVGAQAVLGKVVQNTKRECPKKIEETLFRCREQCELADEQLEPMRVEAVKLAGNHGEEFDSTVSALKKALADIVARIESFQQGNNDRVRKIVQDFMPKDFRATMVAYQHEKGEKAAKAAVDKLKAKGGTISDKYNLLWDQQMARREKLAMLGKAKGVWKAIIKMIAGVPSVLLNFIKTINDEQGPIEEMRAKFAPNLYTVMGALNTCNIAVTLSLQASDSAQAAELLNSANSLAASGLKEVDAYLVYLADVMYSAPWFVTASELASQAASGGSGASGDLLKASVDAGKSFDISLDVAAGSTVQWQFKVIDKDVGFEVLFGSSVVVENQRHQASAELSEGDFVCKEAGTIQLRWDNTYSFMTGKEIEYRVLVEEPESASAEQ